ITGNNGFTNFNPTITRYNNSSPSFLVISGNSAHVNTGFLQGGDADSDASDQRGTINVSFGVTAIKKVTIRLDNAPGALSNPFTQSIAIGSLSFDNPVLPVTLSQFSASLQNEKAVLKWRTETEINSDHFEVEKSLDGSSWSTIVSVPSHGDSWLPRN